MAAAKLKAAAARATVRIRVTSGMRISIKPPDGCPEASGGVISHGRDERLEGEVELIWISLESFWRFPENGMMEPLSGFPRLKS
jgi:hypothetical protein